MVAALVIFAAGTFAVTLVSSRGQHSKRHNAIARLAMGLEVFVALAASMGYRTLAFIVAIAVVGSFLAVAFTDERGGSTLWQYALRVLKTGWVQR